MDFRAPFNTKRSWFILAIAASSLIPYSMHADMLNIRAIEEVKAKAWSDDVEKIIRDNPRPVIVRGLASAWPAAKWTPEYLAQTYPEADINVYEDYNRSYDEYTESGDINHFLETVKSMPMADAWELLKDERLNYYAIDKAFIEKHPELKDGLHFPKESDRFNYIIHFLFMGSNPTETDLHTHDFHYVFIAQLCGEKVVTLVSPEFKEQCYARLDNYEGFPHYISSVDVENPDLEKYPKIAEVEFLQATLRPGDVLYLPKGWFHDLRAKTQSLSISKFIGNNN